MNTKKRLRLKNWSIALGWIGIIYSTLYIIRPITEFLRNTIPFVLVLNLVFISILALLLFQLCVRIRIKSLLTGVVLLGIMGCYVYGLVAIEIPEEKIHFVQYGVCGFLLYRALALDFSFWVSMCGALVLTIAFGWGDEGIQYLLPNRYYDLRDVGLNAIGGFLGLVLTWCFEREKVR